ncbi:hypothetical protein HDU76_006933 [Blyttiomyces sp. JEL0837]|nr:hypothetical protein HDU76_006933 [Blyttiomyces sp. JEL0837]
MVLFNEEDFSMFGDLVSFASPSSSPTSACSVSLPIPADININNSNANFMNGTLDPAQAAATAAELGLLLLHLENAAAQLASVEQQAAALPPLPDVSNLGGWSVPSSNGNNQVPIDQASIQQLLQLINSTSQPISLSHAAPVPVQNQPMAPINVPDVKPSIPSAAPAPNNSSMQMNNQAIAPAVACNNNNNNNNTNNTNAVQPASFKPRLSICEAIALAAAPHLAPIAPSPSSSPMVQVKSEPGSQTCMSSESPASPALSAMSPSLEHLSEPVGGVGMMMPSPPVGERLATPELNDEQRGSVMVSPPRSPPYDAFEAVDECGGNKNNKRQREVDVESDSDSGIEEGYVVKRRRSSSSVSATMFDHEFDVEMLDGREAVEWLKVLERKMEALKARAMGGCC